MATVDLSRHRQPSLSVVLSDTEHIRVTVPTLELIRDLEANLPALSEVLTGENAEARKAIYDLAARLMSCNREGLTLTGEDLDYKYDLDEESLVVFYSAYIDFIDEIKKAKN